MEEAQLVMKEVHLIMKEVQMHQEPEQELLEEVEATQTQTLMEEALVALVRLHHQVVLTQVQVQVQV